LVTPELLPAFASRHPVEMYLPVTWGDLVSVDTLTPGAAAYLDAAVRRHLTIAVTRQPDMDRTITLNVPGRITITLSEGVPHLLRIRGTEE
jgi:hypothetical protein